MNAMEVRRVAKIPHGTDCGNTSRLRHLEHHSINASDYLNRHVRGDWGDVPADDAKENEFALTRRLRIISSYVIEGEKGSHHHGGRSKRYHAAFISEY